MARKHVKYESARWYYWCDRLGLLVWQDMPSGDAQRNDESRANYRRELQAMIDALHNLPVDRHVGAVQRRLGTARHAAKRSSGSKQYDPSRPVNEASGWHDRGSGDVSDMHSYPGPGHARAGRQPRRACWASSAGWACRSRGHTWQQERELGIRIVQQRAGTHRCLREFADRDASAHRPRPGGGRLHANVRCGDRSQRPHDVRPRAREDGRGAHRRSGAQAVSAAAGGADAR